VIAGAMNGSTFLTYVERCLAPTLHRGDIVIIDNLPAHKVAGVTDAMEAVVLGARTRWSHAPVRTGSSHFLDIAADVSMASSGPVTSDQTNNGLEMFRSGNPLLIERRCAMLIQKSCPFGFDCCAQDAPRRLLQQYLP